MDINEAFCAYFADGANKNRRIGIESEHFVLRGDGTVCPYEEGTRRILEELAADFEYKNVTDGHLIGLACDAYALSVEPGGQLEVSISPQENAAEICEVFEAFYAKAVHCLEKYGVRLATFGALEKSRVGQIPLIPKKRYEYMDRYFARIGEYGRYMMRATASCQVSVDYADEADFVNKFRAAYLLTPVFALLAANGGEGGFLKRLDIWEKTDPGRTRIPSDLFAEDFGFSSYARCVTETPAIFMPGIGFTGDEKIGSLLEKCEPDNSVIEHCLSMVFPDVRLKKYIEIRVGDAMEYKRAAAYGAFAAAVLYRGAAETVKYLGVSDTADISRAKDEVRKNAYGAQIYGRPVREIIEFAAGFAPEEYAAFNCAEQRG